MRYLNWLILLYFFLFSFHLFGQTGYKQTIRGVVIDKQTQIPIVGVNVILMNSQPLTGTNTDLNGEFRLTGVSIGNQNLQFSFIGYHPVSLSNLLVISGKELVLSIEMEEKVITTEEITIRANKKDQPLNQMALISARSFSVEETERYAGTWFDPSRMAQNYAGVMAMGDQRNDIVIRGNSPLGLLWRLDGINIPNPNHFGSLGTTGGPVSILNNNLLDNSDFYTGAFPAEYGDALSGVFDLQMRSGNNQKREYVAQVGLNGFEFGMEGPFVKNKKASYLASYRYSTLEIFKKLGINFGLSTIPQYQDLSFKINFPNTGIGKISIFGIGGLSFTQILAREQKPEDWTFGRSNLDMRFDSKMGVIGLTHLIFLNKESSKSSRIRTSLAISGSGSTVKADSAFFDKPSFVFYADNSYEIKYSLTSQYYKKINSKDNLSIGLIADIFQVFYRDSFLNKKNSYVHSTDISGKKIELLQYFIQFQHKFSNQIQVYSGIHAQYFPYNHSYSIEPRLSFKWAVAEGQAFSIGAGLHSQMQPRLFYFTRTLMKDGTYTETNKNLGFSKSSQIVMAYDLVFNPNLRFKFETYYQYLTKIPVEQNLNSFSVANYGTDFYLTRTDSLINGGIEKNYGVEFTLEKFLSKNYYFLCTASLFDSKYKGSDGIERNTVFNGKFVVNALAGYSLKLGASNSINFDAKVVWAGGKRYIPIDLNKSNQTGAKVLINEQAYEPQFPDYYRIDIRIGFKLNRKLFSMETAFDVQNINNHKNILLMDYSKTSKMITYDYQLGLFYVFVVRFLF